MTNRITLCILLLGLGSVLLHAQQPNETSDDATAQQLIQQAYEAAKEAETFDQYDKIVNICDAALAKGPDAAGRKYLMTLSAWGLNRRGKELSSQAAGTFDADAAAKLEARAMADFQEALRRDPDKWQALHNRGVSYALLGEYAKALDDFNRTISLNPKYPNVYFNRGEIRYAQEDYAAAATDYSTSIKLSPEDWGAYAARAHARFRLTKYEDALADFSKAISLDTDNAHGDVYSDRGDVYAHLGRWQQAARDYRQAVEIDSDFGRAYMGAAWIMATCPDEQFRDATLALDSAKKAIELDGENDWRYLDTLAAAQANGGDYEQAQATIKKAIAASPEDRTADLANRLNLYTEGKPYRDTAQATSN